jgi:hypothetical protein
MCFDHVCLSTGCEESQYNAALSQGIIYLRFGAGQNAGLAPLAINSSGRRLLALGRFICELGRYCSEAL